MKEFELLHSIVLSANPINRSNGIRIAMIQSIERILELQLSIEEIYFRFP